MSAMQISDDATTGGKALRIGIIGAGPAGIAAGHALLAEGFENFTIFEKSARPPMAKAITLMKEIFRKRLIDLL